MQGILKSTLAQGISGNPHQLSRARTLSSLRIQCGAMQDTEDTRGVEEEEGV